MLYRRMGSLSGRQEVELAMESNTITRRDALRKAGLAAGAAAFATPTVVGVFSSRASAQRTLPCDPGLDSDAVVLTAFDVADWNQNCGGNANTDPFPPPGDEDAYGRYNGQDATSVLAVNGNQVTVQIGEAGTDNEWVSISYYTITNVPAGWQCFADFRMENANGGVGCPSGVETLSSPGNNTDPVVPFGALALPYCADTTNQGNADCPSSAKLVLLSVTCCPI